MAGVYTGTVDVGEDRFAAELTVQQRGHRLEGELASRALRASGSGEIEGEGFRLELGYGDECRGVLVLSGRQTSDGRLIGSALARDCTGRASGSFTFDPGG